MKLERCAWLVGIVFMTNILTSCAAGSATAGYALKAREADYLSACGEQRIVNRVKREIMLESGVRPSCNQMCD
jgi:hypothetical protein